MRRAVFALGLLVSVAAWAGGKDELLRECLQMCKDDTKQCKTVCRRAGGGGVCDKECGAIERSCVAGCEKPPPRNKKY